MAIMANDEPLTLKDLDELRKRLLEGQISWFNPPRSPESPMKYNRDHPDVIDSTATEIIPEEKRITAE